MYSAIPFLVGLTVVAFAVLLVLTFIPAYRDGAAARFGRSVGLALPDSLEKQVSARLTVRLRGATIGAALATVAMLLLVHNGIPVASDHNFSSFIIVGGAFVGVAVGAGVASALRGRFSADDRVRVARAQAVEMPDYVAPFELVSTRVGVALAAVAVPVAAVLGAESGLVSLAAALTVVAVFALVLFEVASRHVVRRGQPVGTQAELAWDDAIRASLLRDLITAPLALGLYALFIAGVCLSGVLADALGGYAGLIAQTAILLVLLAVAFAGAVYSIVSKPQRHVLRRLWPDLAVEPAAAPAPTTDAA